MLEVPLVFLSWYWSQMLPAVLYVATIGWCFLRVLRPVTRWSVFALLVLLTPVTYYPGALLANGASTVSEKVTIGRELGVDLWAYPHHGGFPGEYFAAQATRGSTQAQVRQLARGARVRYDCHCGDSAPSGARSGCHAEKYVFLADDPLIPLIPTPWFNPQIVNVWYDQQDRVVESQMVDSSDRVRRAWCTRA